MFRSRLLALRFAWTLVYASWLDVACSLLWHVGCWIVAIFLLVGILYRYGGRPGGFGLLGRVEFGFWALGAASRAAPRRWPVRSPSLRALSAGALILNKSQRKSVKVRPSTVHVHVHVVYILMITSLDHATDQGASWRTAISRARARRVRTTHIFHNTCTAARPTAHPHEGLDVSSFTDPSGRQRRSS